MYNSTSRFWKIASCLPLATAAVSASAQQPTHLPADSGQYETGIWTFHQEHVLGTSLELSVRATNQAEAGRAEAAVLAVFDHNDSLLSTWRSDSEVSRWAKTRFEPVAVSPELFEVLTAFETWRERTGGALDPSVEAATRLWRSTTAEGRVPSDHEIAVAVEAMQQPHWTLNREHQTATRLSDVPLALASFTKSYISSRAADAALKAGATGVMLNVGGDVVVRGNLTQLVAVADPLEASENDHAMGTTSSKFATREQDLRPADHTAAGSNLAASNPCPSSSVLASHRSADSTAGRPCALLNSDRARRRNRRRFGHCFFDLARRREPQACCFRT